MASYNRVAAVTGGNKGIGLAIVRQLALQYPKSSFNSGPFLIYLTARNQERGEKALQDINDDAQLKKAKALKSDGGLAEIKYLPLDIDSQDSIKSFAEQIGKSHPKGIDFLINNAAVALDGFDADVVKKTLHSNYYGALELTKHLLPHMVDGGRFVHLASTASILDSKYSASIRKRFLEATETRQITDLMEEFTTAVEKNDYKSNWPGAAYKVSKAGLAGLTKTMALENGDRVLINCADPGYVNTDMTKGRGTKTPDEGAQLPVHLALGDIGGTHGKFWRHGEVSAWERV
ncbi:hypothetical protein LTS08_000786 [Lithohypha guttulata]|uniref:Carbonyl reductase n=1 Tax=Lithohypha guttulata TaxID=1690604 RepID=A0AAN7Y857_9EURO|nr:hypothetical protein LTR51_006603 [Lithohypha guttulata]KAK5088813.1 hypothetical protein LTR05_003035 [Lithohypha guttulata]KAK5106665.1 hypothetical protein LTS08_000786 [Lithohypha guttulata]